MYFSPRLWVMEPWLVEWELDMPKSHNLGPHLSDQVTVISTDTRWSKTCRCSLLCHSVACCNNLWLS